MGGTEFACTASTDPVHDQTMTPDSPNTLDAVRLVLGVARLGEIDLRGWWQGHALDRTGQYVLSSMFRRTWRPAALQLDISAAARMHDELLGRTTALHLFSDLLPFRRWATSWLAEQKTTENGHDLLATLEAWDLDQAISALRDWCDPVDPASGESLGNGHLLGRLDGDQLEDPELLMQTVRRLGASYLNQTGAVRPPYFDLVR
jgi:hypothetical protein